LNFIARLNSGRCAFLKYLAYNSSACKGHVMKKIFARYLESFRQIEPQEYS